MSSHATVEERPDLPSATTDHFPVNQRLLQHAPRALWAVVVIVVVILGFDVVGLPGMLVIAGAWLLGTAFHLASPASSGPVAWAAAVIAEVSLLGAGSGALALLSPHNHGTAVLLTVVAAPAVLGAAAIALMIRPFRARTTPPHPARPELALLVHLAGFVVARWIASDRWHGVAWAMSGDARNHVLIMRSILSAGGLSLSELQAYPALVDAVAALLSGAGHRVGLAPGALMVHDAQAIAATYVLSAIAVGCLLVAVLAELLPAAIKLGRGLPLGVIAVMLVCAATSATPLLLGTSLKDGFISAYGAIPMAIAAVVLAVRCCAQPSPLTLALLGPASITTFASWTLLAVVPMTLCVVTLAVVLVTCRGRALLGPGWLLGIASAAGSVFALSVVWLTHLATLRTTFATPGSITAPQPRLLDLLGLILVGLILLARHWPARLQLLGPALATVAAIQGARWVQAVHGSPVQTYYSAKMLYLVCGSLIWVPFALVQHVVVSRVEAEGAVTRLRALRIGVGALALALGAMVVVNFSASLPNSLTKAQDGWTQPDAAMVAETAKFADQGKPFIFWAWSDPGNERLGEFWALATWNSTPTGGDRLIGNGPALPGGAFYWAYTETGSAADLCAISTAIPGLVVVTGEGHLDAFYKKSCPAAKPQIVIRPRAK